MGSPSVETPISLAKGGVAVDEPITVGDVLRAVRTSRGWTQQRMALEVGCDAATICRFERNTRPIPADFLIAAARNFGCPEIIEHTPLWREWARLTGYYAAAGVTALDHHRRTTREQWRRGAKRTRETKGGVA